MKSFVCRLLKANKGISLMEFALGLPFISLLGMGGLEYAQYALAVHKTSQAANMVADTLSRVGASSGLATTQLREIDVIDSFRGVQQQDGSTSFGQNGRIIVSSLERNKDGGQWIHWQRCFGALNATSAYGVQGTGKDGTAFLGMGPATSVIKAPPGANQAVIFVEIIYRYQPMFSSMILPQTDIKSYGAYIARTLRDTSDHGIFNPSPQVPTIYTCSRFTAT